MSDDRVARALLRLYPRTWRARYGVEFLALVSDTGLTWRAALDVIAAASIERARVLIALWRFQAEPDATLRTIGAANFRELMTEGLAVLALMGATVLALAVLGVPLPGSRGFSRWMFYMLLINGVAGEPLLPRPASPFDRIAFRFGQFAVAVAMAGLVWLAALTLLRIGLPEPPAPLAFFGILGVAALCAARFTFRAFRSAYRAFRAPGYVDTSRVGPLEKRAWAAAFLACAVAMMMLAPLGEVFWSMVYGCHAWVNAIQARRFRDSLAPSSSDAITN